MFTTYRNTEFDINERRRGGKKQGGKIQNFTTLRFKSQIQDNVASSQSTVGITYRFLTVQKYRSQNQDFIRQSRENRKKVCLHKSIHILF